MASKAITSANQAPRPLQGMQQPQQTPPPTQQPGQNADEWAQGVNNALQGQPAQPKPTADAFYAPFDQQFGQPLQAIPEDPNEWASRVNSAISGVAGPKDNNAQIIPDNQWDYHTATTDKQGNPLPHGAVGFDPYGRAYYGEGVQGLLNGARSRITDPGTKEAKFDFTKKYNDAGELIGNIASNVEQAGNLTDTFGADSPLTPVLRTIKEGLNGTFAALSLPAQGFERVVGTASELMRSDRQARDLNEAWQASAITYSSFFDVARRDRFLEGIRRGENPEFLAMELENPIAELVGQLVFDPLWIAGAAAKGEKAAMTLERAGAKMTRTGAMKSEQAARIIEELSGKVLTNDVQAAGKLETVLSATQDAVRAVREGVAKYKPGAFSRLTSAQQAITREVAGQHTNWFINTLKSVNGSNPEQIGDALYHFAMLASDNAEHQAVSLAYIVKNHPVPKMALSDEGLATANVLWHTIGDNADEFLEGLQKAAQGGTAGVTEFAAKRIDQASTAMYPSVTSMREASEAVAKGGKITARQELLAAQYKTMGYGVQAAERFASAKIPTLYRKVQGSLVGVYLANPGTAMRNLYSNLFHGFVDQGPKFAVGQGGKVFTPFGGAAAEDVARLAGQELEIASFGRAGAAAEGAQGITSLVPKLQDTVERGTGYMVMRASLQDTMEKLLKPGKYLPDAAPIVDGFVTAGHTAEEAQAMSGMLMRYIVDAGGDIDKAILRFRGAGGTSGMVDSWRDTSKLFSPKMRDFLGKFGIGDEVMERVSGQYASVDEAVQEIIGHIRDTIKNTADSVADEAPRVDQNAPGALSAADMAAAQADGLLKSGESEVYTAMVQAGQNLDNYFSQVGYQIGALKGGNLESIQKSTEVFALFPQVAGNVARDVNEARKIPLRIKEHLEKGLPIDVGEEWLKHFGTPPPPGTTTKQLQGAVWEKYFETASELWRSNYRNLKQRADKLFDDALNQIADPEKRNYAETLRQHYEEMYTEYENISQAFHDGKNLVPKARTDISVGKEGADYVRAKASMYKFPTATENGVPIDNTLLSTINEYKKMSTIEAGGLAHKAAVKDVLLRVNDLAYKQGAGRLRNPEKFILESFGGKYTKFADIPLSEIYDLFKLERRTGEDLLKHAFPEHTINQLNRRSFQELKDITAASRGEVTEKFYNSLDEVPPDIADKALENWRIATGRPKVTINPPDAAAAGGFPSHGRVASRSIKGMEPELQQMEQFIRDGWGKTMGTFDPSMEQILADYSRAAKIKVAEARKIGINVAYAARDFTLLPYQTGKTGLDAAMSYAYPLGFWPTRTYAHWGQRVYTDPAVLSSYAKYREAMEKIHADMPEFYRNNINPAELLGIQTDNPLFFNLEATLNPLNGLTGVDFNDPYKRVDWWTATLDDLGKLGAGGVGTPITAATAIALYMRGEKEAAARWGGRLFPQTAQIKSVLSLGNVTLPDTPFTHGNETDPFVNFFSGGTDPYERRRIGGAGLQKMVDEGQITQEQALDAARTQSGPVWEQAKMLVTQQRAGANLSSWAFGVGWKGRTETDLRIEKFYGEYNSLTKQINGGALDANSTRIAFDQLREKYPFMDLVILSKKDGPDRDRAYAYNTLARIPPGQSGALVEAAGISDELVQKFYDSKGRMEDWAQSDRDKFMASITDLAAVLAVPDTTTKQDWTAAHGAYKDLQGYMQRQFGTDILDKVDGFYAIGNETQKQRDLQNDYLKLHPEVKQAMDLRTQAVAQIPQLNAYYGGIRSIEKYYSSLMYADIKAKLGDDIFDKFGELGRLELVSRAEAAVFKRANPQLAQYGKLKGQWQDRINREIAAVSNMLVPRLPAQQRPDVPQTTGTQAIQQALSPAPQMTWDQWSRVMPTSLQRIVIDYFSQDKRIPSSAGYYLDRLAGDYGYADQDELLQAVGASLFQAPGQP